MAKFRVKELARERGMTQDDLARKSGLKFGAVIPIWQGKRTDPHFSTLEGLAYALGVSIEDLVDRGQEDKPQLRGAV